MIVFYNRQTNMLRISYKDTCSAGDQVKAVKLNSIGEFLRLYKSTKWFRDEEGSDDIYAPYVGEAKDVFDAIANRHTKSAECVTIDFSKKFKSLEEGTSKLIYQPGKGTIHLALRRSNDTYTSFNSICVSNEIRDEFINDCRSFNKKRFMVSYVGERELFNKWNSVIKKEYAKQYVRAVRTNVDKI